MRIKDSSRLLSWYHILYHVPFTFYETARFGQSLVIRVSFMGMTVGYYKHEAL